MVGWVGEVFERSICVYNIVLSANRACVALL